MLGLVGGLHCLGMCGPLAIALPVTGSSRTSYFVGRLVYNFGRVVTYSLLGIVFGLIGKTFVFAGFQRWLSIALGIAILLAVIVGPRFSARLSASRPIFAAVAKLKAALGGLLKKRSVGSMLMIGFLNGFLPCGLVYVALAGAAVTGSGIGGFVYMACFGVGTIPLMLVASLSGKAIQGAFRFNLQKAIPIALVMLAILFILRGMSLGIKYISPDLSPKAKSPGCCSH
ncbi:MAG: sulfite exporter TauE/SafE family protein [Verrucomicrobia bacterium]|nr:sulfite exporter TauE/SafE family protein [Verrucomicrobiota bacterium]